MQLFYHPELDPSQTTVSFGKEESRHIAKVLRKKEGQEVFSTNGKGSLFKLRLSLVEAKHCEAQVLEVVQQEPLPYRLHLAVAPTKLNDRYEWFLEKATEIGMTEVSPIICDHSERRQIKAARYEKIITSAVKQSLKGFMPVLNAETSFSQIIEASHDFKGLKCIAHCEDLPKERLQDIVKDSQDILILIGPEGDFSLKEIELAINAGFKAVNLGDERLRTETAAIVACHTVALLKQ